MLVTCYRWQKRPTTEAEETYYRGKRDLLQRQKRPTIEAKETYYRGKRDLLYVHLKDTVVLAMLTFVARADFEKGSALAAREGDMPEPAR